MKQSSPYFPFLIIVDTVYEKRTVDVNNYENFFYREIKVIFIVHYKPIIMQKQLGIADANF